LLRRLAGGGSQALAGYARHHPGGEFCLCRIAGCLLMPLIRAAIGACEQANSGQKETSSTSGMEETVQTCPTIKVLL
jgi:hypothetical protein